MSEQREITCFFCREFLAVYIEKQLDPTRTAQINSHLKQCHECDELFQKVGVGHQVVKELSQIQPHSDLIKFLQKEHNFWTEFFEKFGWKKWPEGMRWATQLMAVAILLGLTVNIFPWVDVARLVQNLQMSNLVVKKKTTEPVVVENTIDKKEAPAGTPKSEQPEVAARAVVAAPTPVAKATPQVKPSPTPQAVAAAPPSHEEPSPASSPLAVVATKVETKPAESSASSERTVGYVWRGVLKVDAVEDDEISKITNAIIELGGQKAGKVDLGWARGPEDRYYHFVLPGVNHDKLLEALKAEGALNIVKQPHPRIMKEGIERYIINVEPVARQGRAKKAEPQESGGENEPGEGGEAPSGESSAPPVGKESTVEGAQGG